jgi:hypothetical protein
MEKLSMFLWMQTAPAFPLLEQEMKEQLANLHPSLLSNFKAPARVFVLSARQKRKTECWMETMPIFRKQPTPNESPFPSELQLKKKE